MVERLEDWKSIDEVIDFAIEGEQESCDFYMEMASQMRSPVMSETFERFAREELGHKRKLMAFREGTARPLEAEGKALQDLHIADYLVDVKPSSTMSYEDALVFAMKKEKVAFRLYSRLADSITDPAISETFRALAQEEAKHKLRFEVEYDEISRRSGN